MLNEDNIMVGLIFSCGVFNLFLWFLYVYNVILMFKRPYQNQKKSIQTTVVEPTELNNLSESQPEPLNVFILRGFPGAGKKYFVFSNEYNRRKVYSVCNTEDFFYSDGEFNYDTNLVDNAKNYTLNKFIRSLSDKINNIYVIGIFEQPWMYQNFIDLAVEYNYNFTVLDFYCPNKDYLAYYNSRCNFNIPMKVSTKYYNRWVYDEFSLMLEPYLPSDLPGDCIPSYPRRTHKDLDRELDEILSNNFLGNVNNINDLYYLNNVKNLNFYNTNIRYINNKTAEKISKWEVVNVLKNKLNIEKFINNKDTDYIDFLKNCNHYSIEFLYYDIFENSTIFENQ